MRCEICGGSSFAALPEPHPHRSILSDLRVVDQPLRKSACRSCGLVRRRLHLAPGSVYDDRYELYAHEPGRGEEMVRQQAYAEWLAPYFEGAKSVYEAGAGNGSLLLALSQTAGIRGGGVEPAPQSSAFARDAGFDVTTGLLQTNDLSSPPADVAYAINVIEHTAEPARFVRMLASHSADRVAIVCPNGSVPNVELLFADHIYSFEPMHIRALFEAASLTVDAQIEAPASLGPFFLTIGRKAAATERIAGRTEVSATDQKRAYLEAWSRLDGRLSERLETGNNVVCFGGGEAAGLLRAYAPESWEHVNLCAMDAPQTDAFGSLSMAPYRAGLAETALLGVRPGAQAAVGARLQNDGYRVVRWDDLVSH